MVFLYKEIEGEVLGRERRRERAILEGKNEMREKEGD